LETLRPNPRHGAASRMAGAGAAALDVSRVSALSSSAVTEFVKQRPARAAELYGRALEEATALCAPDSVLVAYLQLVQADAELEHAQLVKDTNDPEAHRLRVDVFQHLLPLAAAALERRRAAGTLLGRACRPEEAAWFGKHLVINKRLDPSFRVLDGEAESIGYRAYLMAACLMLEVFTAYQSTVTPSEALWQAFVLRALALLAQPHSRDTDDVESKLAVSVQRALKEGGMGARHEFRALLAAAWARVEASGVVASRQLFFGATLALQQEQQLRVAAAQVVAARGLHACAAPACGAREAHVSQFKKCSACKTTVYCSKEHQVAHWPQHKAACKAVRAAAAQAASDEGAPTGEGAA
jgi:hypothetical protein